MLHRSNKIAMSLTSISESSVAERQEAGMAGWNWTLWGIAEIVMSSERRDIGKNLQKRQRPVFRLTTNNGLTDGLGYHVATKTNAVANQRLPMERRWNHQHWNMNARGVLTLACYAAFPQALLTSANWNAEHLCGPAEICTAFQEPLSICVQLQSLDSHRRQHEIILIKRNEHMADNNSLRDIFDSLARALPGPAYKT